MPTIHGQRIMDARLSRGMAREELGQRIGMSEYLLYRAEILDEQPTNDQIIKMVMVLHYPLPFFTRAPSNHLKTLSGSSLLFHGQSDELCQFCGGWFVSALCDHPTGRGVTCDARLCDYCRVRPGPNTDYCPDHKQFAGQLV